MSIALDTTRGIDPSGIPTGVVSYVSVFKAPEIVSVVRRVFDGGDVLGTEKLDACRSSSSSSSSSSIGRNSDLSERSSDGEDSGENEAQSSYKGPLDMMDSLEEVLPIRRGISKFYNGKSKSFTNLGEGSTTCAVKDIAKPENAYIRKCRNRMAFNHGWDKNRSFPRRSNNVGISKRPIMTPSCSSLALAVAMGNSDSYSSEDSSNSGSNSRSPPRLPPLHPRSRASNGNLASLSTNPPQSNFSPGRSYSLADLQECSINTENIACNRPK